MNPGHHAHPTPDTVSNTPDTTPAKPSEPQVQTEANRYGSVRGQISLGQLFANEDAPIVAVSNPKRGAQQPPTQVDQIDAEFPQWWQVVPKKVDKADFQVRRPDTLLFATIEGLQKQAGVSKWLLRRLVLKELADNGLDTADAAGRHGQVEIERPDQNRYRIADQGAGIQDTPDDLARLFALGRPMVSGKFWRLPESGALGNGLRIIVGTVAATGGTLEVSTRGQRVLLHPRKRSPWRTTDRAES
jgi:Histidine kinase-, DNA gyrase B-, and HSP90-like ATPase